MSLFYRCERCRAEAPPIGKDYLPTCWKKVADKDLCAKCSEELEEFLREKPRVKESR